MKRNERKMKRSEFVMVIHTSKTSCLNSSRRLRSELVILGTFHQEVIFIFHMLHIITKIRYKIVTFWLETVSLVSPVQTFFSE